MNKSGFMKDAIILFVITLVAGICLGAVYEITKAPIQKANMAAKLGAYRAVFEQASDFKPTDSLTNAVEDSEDVLAAMDYGNVVVDDAVEAVDENGTVVGYVISSTSKDGYGGAVSISVGIDLEGVVKGIEYLAISETPGLGMNATNDDFKNKYKDKAVESFTVTKSGAAADNEIDAISGATITSSAVTNAVNAAICFVHNCVAQ